MHVRAVCGLCARQPIPSGEVTDKIWAGPVGEDYREKDRAEAQGQQGNISYEIKYSHCMYGSRNQHKQNYANQIRARPPNAVCAN